MRISTGLVFQNSLNALLDQQSRLMHTQQQITTGKRILSPADDPAGSAMLLGINQTLQLNQQYQGNITSARNQLSQTESTLGSINNVLDRVGFVRALGFTIHRVPGEEDVVEARLALA